MVMRVRVDDNGDAELEELEKRLGRLYAQAEKDARKIYQDHLEQYESELKDWEARVASGDASQAAFDRWKRTQAASLTSRESMADQLAARAARANEEAAAMVADELPRTFADSANRAAFEVDRAIGVDTGFTLYNQDAVRELVMRDPDLLPHVGTDYASDIAWNKQKFSSAITSGILTGASVPRVKEQLKAVFGMNDSQATRAARTAFTSAQNAGRMHTYDRARLLGINMDDVWMATLDTRTRDSHRLLDGEVKKGERFSNGCRFPGDPQGEPGEVYNCRCRLAAVVEGFKRDYSKMDDRWSDLPPGTTYEEWKKGKATAPTVVQPQAQGHAVVEGKDIFGTWTRRPDLYDFEIEDVIAAQGFDGKPRIVGADEFDRAVKQANGGDGLIMQRTYSAPDQVTLDAYREQLYDGKWYVDCSTGGAQYGQGMYCVADYTGSLSDGIKAEMEHYIGLGEDRAVPQVMATKASEIAEMVDGVTVEQVDSFLRFRIHGEGSAFGSVPFDKMTPLVDAYGKVEAEVRATGASFHYVETMTLDPSARVITWRDAMRLQDEAVDSLINKGLTPEQVRGSMPSDLGSFAASRGYDAINAVGHGASGSYTVVLNRTKLIIRRPE